MKTPSKLLIPLGLCLLWIAAAIGARDGKQGVSHAAISSFASHPSMAAGSGDQRAEARPRHAAAPIAIELAESTTGPDAEWTEGIQLLTEDEANELPNPEDGSDVM